MYLPLSDIVDVVVNVSPSAVVRNEFNLGLIMGDSTVISTSDRVKVYNSLAEMIAGGWAGTEDEYEAAQLYFSQSGNIGRVAIGRWNTAQSAETALQAITACRTANTEWYACYICGAAKADVLAVAAYIESCEPVSVFFYDTDDADVLAKTADNVMDSLMDDSIRRTIGQYSTEDYAAVTIMGYAMGSNTGLANSAYTLMFKPEVGITAEELTSAELAAIQDQNGNAYVTRGSTYNVFEKGVMADGTFFDEVIFLDTLANGIQTAIISALQSNHKIPQTEEGVTLLVNAITDPCEEARSIGFIAPGVWDSATVLGLNTGDALPNGYIILADKISNQSAADRADRKAPPIYVCVKLAGAVQSAVINVLVNT
jgi:hypothetical protein